MEVLAMNLFMYIAIFGSSFLTLHYTLEFTAPEALLCSLATIITLTLLEIREFFFDRSPKLEKHSLSQLMLYLHNNFILVGEELMEISELLKPRLKPKPPTSETDSRNN